ncbi:MAG: CopK family periplasmic copper-binding protein [Betaproteobacteria bacterium]|nr:CopK family periplasmic copper-binding protein [Betaproteobacteria bacterium]
MRKIILPLLMLLSLSAFAAQEQTIELKDGGKVMVQKDGTMVHIDAAGNRVKMKDGGVMEARDGTMFMMKNDALWKKITEKGTLNPKF